ncbi:MAG: HAD family hydrolase [Dictyoglomus sp.]|nr:HAD family hydrolase [Dictyoglomus sp.]MCX7941504.1 HAD family hydrolase [Dictyoglomaceae bacterium]MDW8188853.1 HAD family hydrolase [Dictyoglomus sp.]
MEIKGVIWDWDGTLVDSFLECFNATKKVLSLFGINISLEEYRENFAPNWYEMYKNFGLKRDYWEIADNLWYKYFNHSCIKWRDGALENLSFLKNYGIKQGVVTASTKLDIEKESFHLKPERFIDCFITWEDSLKKKPDPESLFKILDILNLKPEEIVYIGDTSGDIIMGKKAKVKLVIAIQSNFNKKEELLKNSPDFFFENLWDLLNFWKKILK